MFSIAVALVFVVPPRWRRSVAVAGTVGVAVCLATGLVLIPALRASVVGAVAGFLAGALLIVAAAVAVLIGVRSVLPGNGR